MLSSCRTCAPRCRVLRRSFYTTAIQTTAKAPEYYKTGESDPSKHEVRHVGRFYQIPDSALATLGKSVSFLPKPLHDRNELLGGSHCIMVRLPALEVISYIRQLNLDSQRKAPKFVFWGRPGHGKSLSFCHVAHFCHQQNFVLLNFKRIKNWLVNHKEIAPSEWKPERFDHVADAHALLQEFLAVNEPFLNDAQLRFSYKWSVREQTVQGTNLIGLIKHGIERPKFSADCLNALMKELVTLSQEGQLKVALLVDGINCIFEDKSLIHKSLKKRKGPFYGKFYDEAVGVDQCSVMYNLKKTVQRLSRNAVIVCTVDSTDRIHYDRHEKGWWRPLQQDLKPRLISDYPFDLLGQPGWEALHPFIPIQVSKFSHTEMDSMIDYYVDKKYIKEVAATEAGRNEIHFLTGRSPGDFFHFSNLW